MLYSPIEHNKVTVGQRWACQPDSKAQHVVIVAVDSSPTGIVVNVIVEVTDNTDNNSLILAPIEWTSLEPSLGNVVASDVDVSTHLVDYCEWKALANEGKAGVWTCSVDKIIQTISAANPDPTNA